MFISDSISLNISLAFLTLKKIVEELCLALAVNSPTCHIVKTLSEDISKRVQGFGVFTWILKYQQAEFWFFISRISLRPVLLGAVLICVCCLVSTRGLAIFSLDFLFFNEM